MDVTFVGSRQMEVRDAVKLSSWPKARQLSAEKPHLSYERAKRLQFVPTMTPVEATRLRVDPSLSRLYRGYVRAPSARAAPPCSTRATRTCVLEMAAGARRSTTRPPTVPPR